MFFQGFEKTAFHAPKLTAPKGGAISSMHAASSVPNRVGAAFQPGSPVKGLKSVTGAPAQATFGRPLSRFGTYHRRGLVSRTAVSR